MRKSDWPSRLTVLYLRRCRALASSIRTTFMLHDQPPRYGVHDVPYCVQVSRRVLSHPASPFMHMDLEIGTANKGNNDSRVHPIGAWRARPTNFVSFRQLDEAHSLFVPFSRGHPEPAQQAATIPPPTRFRRVAVTRLRAAPNTTSPKTRLKAIQMKSMPY
ncbi:hypothetical protein BKA56DRAFT_624228 [Ilyonectria sp. MPI-CAGE-AT-0026]|nr:hypothetical protein BKA56DRAFT_624228 [Ilyonectria sp. MPI-CAGE-AT-0026]